MYNRALSPAEVQQLYQGVPLPPDTTAPTVPAVLAATPGFGTVSLTWNASTDNVGVTGYRVYRDGGSVAATTSTGYQDNGLSAGTPYSYTVAALDAAGNESAQSAAVVATTLATPPPVPPGNTVYFSFDEGSGTSAADSSGQGNNGTLLNGVVWIAGKTGTGLSLDGVNDHVRVPDSASLNTAVSEITVAAWVYRQSNQTGTVTVASRKLGTGYLEPFFLGFMGGNYRWFVNTVGPGYSSYTIGGAAPVGQWTHLVGIYDGSLVRLYINGVQEFAIAHSGPLVSANGGPLTLGASYNDAGFNAQEPLHGRIDEFQMYNRALSPAEVQQLYQGVPLPPDTTAPTVPAVLAATPGFGTVSLTWNASTDNVGVTGYRVYRDGGSVAATTSTGYQDNGLSAGTPYSYTVAALDAAGNESDPSAAVVTTTLETPPPGPPGNTVYFSFDEGSGTSTADSSGQGNNGTLLNGAVWIAGKTGTGLSLDGVNDHVRVPDSASLNTAVSEITVAAWVYRQSNQTGTVTVASRQLGTGYLEPFFLGFMGGNYRWFVNTVGPGYSSYTIGGAAPVGQWTHLVGIYDGSLVRLYINGVQEFAIAHSGQLVSANGGPLTLGASYNDAGFSAQEPLHGRIDEFQMYNRALSPAEIEALYQAGNPDSTPPSVAVTYPTGGETLSGVATFTASASDDQSISTVQFKVDGVNVGTAGTSEPYQVTFTTGVFANGQHSLTAVARDTSGNVATSTEVYVTFSNTGVWLGNVMPLGDSITLGYVSANNPSNEDGGYRRYLWESLTGNGNYLVDFVGSQANGIPAMDRDHEGHGGWRVDQLTPMISTWFASNPPDSVLLMIGTNDLLQNDTPVVTLNKLGVLLDQIHSTRPSARILVASIVGSPTGYVGMTPQEIIEYNSGIPELVNSRAGLGWNIRFVDIYNLSGLDYNPGSADFSSDNLHPSPLGYSKMAAVWAVAITLE